jgi:hypothetical protein
MLMYITPQYFVFLSFFAKRFILFADRQLRFHEGKEVDTGMDGAYTLIVFFFCTFAVPDSYDGFFKNGNTGQDSRASQQTEGWTGWGSELHGLCKECAGGCVCV